MIVAPLPRFGKFLARFSSIFFHGREFKSPVGILIITVTQVFIAQREFEHAAALIFRARAYCRAREEASPQVREAGGRRLDSRTDHLVSVLRAELSSSPPMQQGVGVGGGGAPPRSARRAVALLVRLGRSAVACRLFLQHRSAVAQAAVK